MLQNGMVMSCVQSAEQIGSKKLAIGKKWNVYLLQFFSDFVQPIVGGGGGGGAAAAAAPEVVSSPDPNV